MAPGFSMEEDEVLVEEIAKHPSLWQLSHAKYKDQRVEDNIWAEFIKHPLLTPQFKHNMAFSSFPPKQFEYYLFFFYFLS